jgi:hypothetical protein
MDSKKAKQKIRLVKQRVNDYDSVMTDIKMKFLWNTRVEKIKSCC